VTAFETLSTQSFCYLTTIGRVTAHPHTIEIWFAIEGGTLYMLSGNGEDRGSDWVKNLVQTQDVSVRIDQTEFRGKGRIVTEADEDALARRLLLAKYEPTYSGDLSDWGRTALPVAVDLESVA